jgi:hypothetical protein
MDPPYGRFAPKFVKRFCEELASGSNEQAILLLGTHHLNTKWIQPIFSSNPVICLPAKRLQFSGSLARPAHGSVIVGLSVDQHRFMEICSQFGPVR